MQSPEQFWATPIILGFWSVTVYDDLNLQT
jgi:hypothetical protein